MVASQVFAESSDNSRKVLVIYSDMKNDTTELNIVSLLSTPSAVPMKASTIPNLKDTEVHVLGADADSLSTTQWTELRNYWTTYFKDAGARLRTYSTLRQSELPIH